MQQSHRVADHADINLAGNLDRNGSVDALAREFNEIGRVQIPGVLQKQAAASIHDCLSNQTEWSRVFQVDGKHYDTDAAAIASWSEEKRVQLRELVHEKARSGFQYHYDALPIYDIYHHARMQGHLVHAVFEFLNSEAFLSLMRAVTGDDEIAFADAQATRYRPGDFLTRHDDVVSGKDRRAAYVLNLSRNWNPDWGGILQFFDASGNVKCGYTPSFNTLNVFQIPVPHSVAIVAPFAAASRFSISGWLRSGEDPLAGRPG